MQTFLPFADFTETAKCLDNKRLNKQKVEAFQILNVLLNRTTSTAWRNHPAVKMWKGYENSLKHYFNVMRTEWINRGFNNSMKEEIIEGNIIHPPWLGNSDFHISHQSNLLRKDNVHYSKFFVGDDNKPYIWP